MWLQYVLLFFSLAQIAGAQDLPVYIKPEEESKYYHVYGADTPASDMTLTCEAMRTPQLSVEWYRMVNDRGIILDPKDEKYTITGDRGERLVFVRKNQEVYTNDIEGTYFCKARNDFSAARSYNYVKVFGSVPSGVSPDEPRVSGKRRGYLLLERPSNAENLVVPFARHKWFKRGIANPVEVTSDLTHAVDGNGNLHLLSLTDADFGVYDYQAQNELDVSATLLRVTVSQSDREAIPPGLESMYPPPTVKNVFVIAGQPATFYCIYTGVKGIGWSSKDINVPPNTDSLTLSIDITSEMNGTEIMCLVNGAVSRTYILIVQEKPRWAEGGELVPAFAQIGQSHTFKCEVEAMPRAQIEWFINTEPFNHYNHPTSKPQKSADNTRLTFENVEKDQAISISCLASNSFRNEAERNSLWGLAYLKPVHGSRMERTPQDTDVYFSDEPDLRLQCDATIDKVFPNVDWIWTRDGDLVTTGLSTQPTRDNGETRTYISILTIQKTSNPDVQAGLYVCEAVPKFDDVPQPNNKANDKWLLHKGAAPVSAASAGAPWWLWVVLGVALLVILAVVLIAILMRRRRGEDYSVDTHERKAGHDPERELAEAGFKDYKRPPSYGELPPHFEMDEDMKPMESDSDSMGEYGDLDTGKFNEDGSFIGQYGSQRKRGRAAANGPKSPTTAVPPTPHLITYDPAPRTPQSRQPATPQNHGRQQPGTPQSYGRQQPGTPQNYGRQQPGTPQSYGRQQPGTPQSRGGSVPVVYQPSPQSRHWSPHDTVV